MPRYKSSLGDRAILRLSGPDTEQFLQGLITQDIAKLAPDAALYASLLTPQGKIIADFFVITTGTDILIDCARDIVDTLQRKLRFYKLRAHVEISDESDLWQVAALWDDQGQALTMPTNGHAISITDPRHNDLGLRLVVPADEHQAVYAAIEAAEATPDDYNRHRLTLGIPVFGEDIQSEQTFPLDVNLDALNGVDYAKGCFVGQEVTSRMKRKGNIRKRIWRVTGNTANLAAGDSLMAGDTTVAEITSTGPDLALARVRLDRIAKSTSAVTTSDGKPVNLTEPDYLGETA